MQITVEDNPMFKKQSSDIQKPMIFSGCWWKPQRKNLHKSSLCEYQLKWHPHQMGKSKNIPVRTNDIPADRSEEHWAASPTVTCGGRETVGLWGEVSVGKSAEALARLNVTMVTPWPRLLQKTESERKQTYSYHFLLVNLLTWKFPT